MCMYVMCTQVHMFACVEVHTGVLVYTHISTFGDPKLAPGVSQSFSP